MLGKCYTSSFDRFFKISVLTLLCIIVWFLWFCCGGNNVAAIPPHKEEICNVTYSPDYPDQPPIVECEPMPIIPEVERKLPEYIPPLRVEIPPVIYVPPQVEYHYENPIYELEPRVISVNAPSSPYMVLGFGIVVFIIYVYRKFGDKDDD